MRTLALLAALAACTPERPLGNCLYWEDCGPGGACEYAHVEPQDDAPIRFACSFADTACPSGRRFGTYSSPERADACVPFDGGFDGICDAEHACTSGLACRTGRCVAIAELSATGELVSALCSHVQQPGGDLYVWGIAYEVLGPGRFLPLAFADNGLGAPPTPPAPIVPITATSAGKNHFCAVGPGVSGCVGRGDILGPGGAGTWGTATPNGPHRGVAAAAEHTCGARQRSVECWGGNADGQLDGTPSPPMSAPPPAVDVGAGIRHVAAGNTFTCAGNTLDEVWCWGGADNWTTDTFAGPRGKPGPVLGLGPGTITWLDAGEQHACAVKGGTVWCWGANNAGQTTGLASTIPEKPNVPFNRPSIAVAAGRDHTCAVTMDNEIWCWGSNAQGQLGSPTASTGPVRLPRQQAAIGEIAAGDDFTCAVLADSLIHCWGAPAVTSPPLDRIALCLP